MLYSTEPSTRSLSSPCHPEFSVDPKGDLITMSKKIVIKADLVGSKCRAAVLSTVAKLRGIKSMDIDAETCTLTVVGAVDPVSIVLALKKACLAAAIVSVEDDKPEEPAAPPDSDEEEDPCHCQEASVQACVPDCCYYPAFRAAPYGYGYCDERPVPAGAECTIQ